MEVGFSPGIFSWMKPVTLQGRKLSTSISWVQVQVYWWRKSTNAAFQISYFAIQNNEWYSITRNQTMECHFIQIVALLLHTNPFTKGVQMKCRALVQACCGTKSLLCQPCVVPGGCWVAPIAACQVFVLLAKLLIPCSQDWWKENRGIRIHSCNRILWFLLHQYFNCCFCVNSFSVVYVAC